jgi:hypothetical protein
MALVLVAAIGLGSVLNHTRVQRRAVDAIERVGGRVMFDFQTFEEGGPQPPLEPPGPRWLRSLIGDEWFRDVVFVDVRGTDADDELLAQVAHFHQLEILYMGETSITDAGLGHLSKLRHLGELGVENTRVGDAGIASISRMTNLVYLSLRGTQVSDVALRHLQGLVNLESLNLSNTRISNQGLRELNTFRKLTSLYLSGTLVTEISPEAIANLRHLGYLTLSRPAYDKAQSLNKLPPDLVIILP